MRKVSLLLPIFGLLAFVSLPTTSAHAQATRTWVSGVGDDVNPCSRTAPCKTFAGAISKTAAGGEIDCLDPGGFGAVTITKSITIDCGPFAGGILASATNGVIINAASTDKVILRNLVINGAGTTLGLNGIRYLAGAELHLDRVVIQNFSTTCVDMTKSSFSFLYANNSVFTECPTGIKVSSTASFAIASISYSMFYGISGIAIQAATANSIVNVSNSTIANAGTGLSATVSGSFANANNNMFTNNTTAVSAASGANLRMSNNDMYDNTTGISAAGANFLSAGNNRVSGGTTTGTTSSGAIPLR
jgi:hypothetical protein